MISNNDALKIMQKEEIKIIIKKAFGGVTLDGGISLDQTKVIDNYGRGVTNEEFRVLPTQEITNNWENIPNFRLDEAECLAHFDRRGFKYYIPALMLRLLDDYDPTSMMTIGTLSILYPKTENWDYLYSRLTDQQNQAIAFYLKALPDLIELSVENKTIVERALNKHWSKYIPEKMEE